MKKIISQTVFITILISASLPLTRCETYEDIDPQPVDCSPHTQITFSDLKASLVGCAVCHNKRNSMGGVDMTDYESVYMQIEPGNPRFSTLYIETTTGTMRDYSNDEENQTIYCWIYLGGPE